MRTSLAIVMVGAALGVTASGVSAQEFFRVAANGPIAFRVESAPE